MRGRLTEKADVFGFGVMALEIVSGRPNSDPSLEEDKIYLLEWVRMNRFSCFIRINEISSNQNKMNQHTLQDLRLKKF